ncbi:copper amine oxidase N-terminal domain-containing protein [Paenibacillus campi]|uniref:copper amine oxidase N-terminal domain-containing protein n=1 Tax=Paenibacillus campi TaxID=3106031 RepID=UPI002AFEBA48|nr:copper amine oxidase N-terminal domain-containing protein [Paenibacillus sp. SGZ-1009]
MTKQTTVAQQVTENKGAMESGKRYTMANVKKSIPPQRLANMMMVSLVGVSLIASAVLLYRPHTTAAAVPTSAIEVLLHARKMAFPDAKPFQDEHDAVMVPIRFISEKLGAQVGYLNRSGQQIVTLQTAQHSVTLTVGSATAVVDGQSKTYDSQIIVKQQRTYVPLRLVSEGLGQTVEWDQVGKWVWIGGKDVPTLEELNLKKQPISTVKKYFDQNNNEYFLKNLSRSPYKDVIIMKQSDFPIKVDDVIIYDIQPVWIDGMQLFRVRTNGKNYPIAYLTTKQDYRDRSAIAQLKTKNSDGSAFYFFKIFSWADSDLQGIVDATPLSPKDLDYISIQYVSLDSMLLLQNPWKE